MDSIFSINNSVLDKLDAASATRTFRNLLWCEAQRCSLSPHRIIISLRTNIGDEGIDARVDGTLGADSVLVSGTNYFQLKAGSAFKPWQRSSLKKELFGSVKKKPSRKALAPGILSCLRSGGHYVLVTFGHDLTSAQQIRSKELLAEYFHQSGFKKTSISVLGQSQLLGLIKSYPSLVLEFTGKREASFFSYDSWKAKKDMSPSLQLAEDQNNFIEKIRTSLRRSDHQHIRILGEPGIGKTRLVLEAMSAEDLSPLTIYVPHADYFQNSILINDLLRTDISYHAILVIDECSNKERASIWDSLKGKANVKLITIDHGPESSTDPKMNILYCPALPDEQIKAIIQSYLPKKAISQQWAEWCSGSPRVAHAVGENLRSNPGDLLKSPATVQMWERFIAGYKGLASQDAKDIQTVLRHLALFTRFGFEDPVSTEAQYICKLVQSVNPAITWPRFQEIVKHLVDRRILQGRRTLFIVPKALHIHLWIAYWDSYGRGFNFQAFFRDVPTQLQRWFLQLFIYAHASPVASNVVSQILSPKGPFSKHGFLVSEAGTRFLDYLAEADPPGTLAVIERSFGTWSKEDLKAWHTGRQDVVFALEKIAVWRTCFHRAVSVLVKFALAENEKYANNSSGVLHNLFLIGKGWAATQATPEERFPVIDNLLNGVDWECRELGLKLCECWFETHGGIRIIGAEFQGLRPELEFWKPNTWGRIYDAWRIVWRHLHVVSRKWSDDQRRQANNVLIDSGCDLIFYENVSNEIFDTFNMLIEDSVTDIRRLTQSIIRILQIRSDALPKNILRKLQQLDKNITGKTFWGRFSRFVLNTSWDEDYCIKKDKVHELKRPSQKVKILASELAKDPRLFKTHLFDLVSADGHRLREFGQAFASYRHTDKTLNAIIAAQISSPVKDNTQFIEGYFSGLKSYRVRHWETAILNLLNSDASLNVGVAVIFSSGMSKNILEKLINLYKCKKIKSSVFHILAWPTRSGPISSEDIEDVLSSLIHSPDEQALRIAIEVASHYYFSKNDPKSCHEDLIYKLLTHKGYFQRELNTMIGYNWHSVAKGFLERYPNRSIDLLRVIILNIDDMSSSRTSNYMLRVADEIVKNHPLDAWPIISELLDSKNKYSYRVQSWLSNEFEFEEDTSIKVITLFDSHTIIAWALQKPDIRPYKLVRCLPKTLDESHGGKLTVLFLDNFADREDISNSLITHFWTGGWTGPESDHLTRKRDQARQWLSVNKSSRILSWLYRYIEFLNRRIAESELEEERRF